MATYQYNRVWEILVTEPTPVDGKEEKYEAVKRSPVVEAKINRTNSLADKYADIAIKERFTEKPNQARIDAALENAEYYSKVANGLITSTTNIAIATSPAVKQTSTRDKYSDKTIALSELDFRLKTEASSRDASGGSTAAVLQLFNMKPETEAKVLKVNNLVRIRAGYGDIDNAGIVFTGTVVSANVKKVGPDRVATLYLKEASVVMDAVRTYISLPPSDNLTWPAVIDAVSSLWQHYGVNITDGSIVKLDSESFTVDQKEALEGGWSVSGFLSDITSHLCKQIGYVWYVDRNILHIHPRDFHRLDDNSGLEVPLEAIKTVNQVSSMSTGISSRGSEPGIEMSMFLDSDIQSDSLLRLPEVPDTYIVTEVNEFTNYSVNEAGTRFDANFEKAFRRRGVKGLYTVRSVSYDLYTKGKQWDVNIVADKVVEARRPKELTVDQFSRTPAVNIGN